MSKFDYSLSNSSEDEKTHEKETKVQAKIKEQFNKMLKEKLAQIEEEKEDGGDD